MNKKILSFLLTVIMVLSLFPAVVFAANSSTHGCGLTDCIVCEVAEKINVLPDEDAITEENAAEVTEQIHAIDRIKGNLTDEQYDEMLALVERGDNGSLGGLAVPVRYMNAVKAIQKLGRNALFITKKFVSDDGSVVNVANAEVKFEITNIETNASSVLTMSTMGDIPYSLSADSEFYSANADGWTYKYILPEGTYSVKEISDSGATVNGTEFVTSKVTYNETVSSDGCVVTLSGEDVSLLIRNEYEGDPIWSFETMVDTGYYAETEDGENKMGVVALNAGILNIDALGGTIVKYGMCIYRDGVLTKVTDFSDASENISQLEADDYRYHAIVKNIPEEDFSTRFQALPYFVVEYDNGYQNTYVGNSISAAVCDGNKWLGTVNPYQE